MDDGRPVPGIIPIEDCLLTRTRHEQTCDVLCAAINEVVLAADQNYVFASTANESFINVHTINDSHDIPLKHYRITVFLLWAKVTMA